MMQTHDISILSVTSTYHHITQAFIVA